MEDHSIFEYTNFGKYSNDFFDLETHDQNEVLHIIDKDVQSAFVHVFILSEEVAAKQKEEGKC